MLKNFFCFLLVVVFCPIAWTQQWNSQNTLFPIEKTTISNIDVVNQSTVWITASSNTIGSALFYAKTTNAGDNWEAKSFSDDTTFWGLAHFDAISEHHAWALMYNKFGLGAKCYRTLDGGNSWEHHCPYSTQSFPNIIHFFDSLNGVTLGDPINNYFEIYTTHNQGQQWTSVDNQSMPQNLPNEYGLAGSIGSFQDTIWCGTTESRILKSTDKGQTWSAIDLSNTIGQHRYISNIALENGRIGMIIFRVPNLGGAGIAYTKDQGDNWALLSPIGQYVGGLCGINHIAAVPYSHRFFITSASSSCGSGSAYTDNEGLDWVQIDALAHYGSGWHNINTGWSGGSTYTDNGQSKDGIYTWEVLPTPIYLDEIKPFSLHSYPNPVIDVYNWSVEVSENTHLSWKITDLQGKTLLTKSYPSFIGKLSDDISLAPFASGIYIFEFQLNERIFTQKIIKN